MTDRGWKIHFSPTTNPTPFEDNPIARGLQTLQREYALIDFAYPIQLWTPKNALTVRMTWPSTVLMTSPLHLRVPQTAPWAEPAQFQLSPLGLHVAYEEGKVKVALKHLSTTMEALSAIPEAASVTRG